MRTGLVVSAAAVAVVAAGCGGGLPTSTPSCSWPLQVAGTATTEQAGLVRCYVQALSRGDAGALAKTADQDPPVRITAADLAHAADAMGGTATATFAPNPSDPADATVAIRYADGATEDLDLHLVNAASTHSWRLAIGTAATTSGPPSAAPS